MDEPKEEVSVPNNNQNNLFPSSEQIKMMGDLMMLDKFTTEQAISNIKPDMRKRVDFKDGNVITINNKYDIIIIRNKILFLINTGRFEELKAIELTYESYYFDPLGTRIVKYVPNPAIDINDIYNNMRKKLRENKSPISDSKMNEIVDEYVCDLLFLDYSFFDNYLKDKNSIIKHTKDVTDANESREEPISPKIESGENDKSALGEGYISTNQLESKSNDKIKLFENIAIYKGKNNLLYGGPKVGKSYFSIEVAKSEKIKKPCFIILEDYSGDQEKRYSINLNNKAISLVNLKDFEETYNQKKTKIEKIADNETNKDFAFPKYHHYKTLKRQNYVRMGIIENENEKLDRIVVIEEIINDAIADGADFICLDSLRGLIEKNAQSFNRSHIRRLLEQVSNKHITFLLINHTTSDRKTMAITDDLRNTFDNIYKLEKEKRDGYIEMTLTEEEARDNDNLIIKFKRTISDNYIVEHEIINSEISENNDMAPPKKNIKYWIKEILANWPSEYIEFEVLYSILQEKTDNGKDKANMERILKELEGKIVARKDGKTWKGGIIILRNNTKETGNSQPMTKNDTPIEK